MSKKSKNVPRKVKILKDERIVDIQEDIVVMTHTNIQEYTKEAAKNIYIDMVDDLKIKTKFMEDFDNIIKAATKQLNEGMTAQVNALKQTDIDFRHINGWKIVQQSINNESIYGKLSDVKKDIKNIHEGLEIWDKCKDL